MEEQEARKVGPASLRLPALCPTHTDCVPPTLLADTLNQASHPSPSWGPRPAASPHLEQLGVRSLRPHPRPRGQTPPLARTPRTDAQADSGSRPTPTPPISAACLCDGSAATPSPPSGAQTDRRALLWVARALRRQLQSTCPGKAGPGWRLRAARTDAHRWRVVGAGHTVLPDELKHGPWLSHHTAP